MKLNLSGLFSQHRWIFLGALGGQGLQLQLTIADPTDSLITQTTVNTVTTNYSTSFTLTDIKILADMCTLNDDLQASFNSALLSGQELRMPIKTWETVVNYLPSDSAGNFDVPISKNYTRLASLFAIFNKNMDANKSGLDKHVNSGYFLLQMLKILNIIYNSGQGGYRTMQSKGCQNHGTDYRKPLGLQTA